MSRRPSPWASAAAGVLALLFAPHCAGPGAREAEEIGTAVADETDGVVISAAVWTLAWDDEGVSYPEAGGFEVETDLGYRVHVESGWVLSHSVSLGPCETASAPAEASWWGLGVRTARAHTGSTEPSTIETSRIEDLLSARDVEVSNSFPAARYCRAHWLLARPTGETAGAEGVSMENRSVLLNGTFERGGVAAGFAIDTWWPQGVLIDLPLTMDGAEHEAARRDGEPRHAFVTVTRYLGRMFDGVDFEVASQDEIDGRVLDNLAGGADIEVALWDPG